MRMGINEFSAFEVINKLDQKDLEIIFKYFGEEQDSKRIAKNIVKERKNTKIDTQKLVKIINYSKRKKNKKTHNATKVFQALRIFVNKEISELIKGLIKSVRILDKNGIVILVSFHSLEDKIIKFFFRTLSENIKNSRYLPISENEISVLNLTKRKPITPSAKEIKINQPSRSAKLRFAVKINDRKNFETEILKKFQFLIDIEKLSEKLWKNIF